MDETLTGTNTLGLYGPGSNDNEGILNIPQSSRIILPSDGEVFYPSEEVESAYSTVQIDFLNHNYIYISIYIYICYNIVGSH